MICSTLEIDVPNRFHYWTSHEVLERTDVQDEALNILMDQSSPGNLPAIRRTVAAILDQRIAQRSEAAKLFVLNLERHFVGDEQRLQVWLDTVHELRNWHEKAFVEWQRRTPWADILEGTDPARIVTRFGPGPLYLADAFLMGSIPSIVEKILTADEPIGNKKELCAALLSTSRPWIADDQWWTTFSDNEAQNVVFQNILKEFVWAKVTLQPRVLLFLPYLETHVRVKSELPLYQVPLLQQLRIARSRADAYSDLKGSLRQASFDEPARDFLIAWTRHEFNTICEPSR